MKADISLITPGLPFSPQFWDCTFSYLQVQVQQEVQAHQQHAGVIPGTLQTAAEYSRHLITGQALMYIWSCMGSGLQSRSLEDIHSCVFPVSICPSCTRYFLGAVWSWGYVSSPALCIHIFFSRSLNSAQSHFCLQHPPLCSDPCLEPPRENVGLSFLPNLSLEVGRRSCWRL